MIELKVNSFLYDSDRMCCGFFLYFIEVPGNHLGSPSGSAAMTVIEQQKLLQQQILLQRQLINQQLQQQQQQQSSQQSQQAKFQQQPSQQQGNT